MRTSSPPRLQETTHYDPIIQEAEQMLKQGPLAVPHLLRTWSEVTWIRSDTQRVSADAETARDNSSRIHIYPSLVKKPRKQACFILIQEFGHLLYGKAAEKIKRRWLHKLAIPSEGQITAVQGRLTPQFETYRSMVDSFQTAMDRYVALNIANALIANGVPYGQCQNVRLKEWGPTQEYCNRRRYHVLIPLVSAYSSKEIFENFGTALADWVVGMNGITESSVAEATHQIIQEMLDSLR